jgi:two-component system nitrate/nitrite response regulator NarL
MIRVLIVHENPLFRVGLRAVLKRHEEMQLVGIVGEIVELEQLLELLAATRPDVVLFDGAFTSSQPARSAAEIVDQVRKAGIRGILVFAPSTDEEDLFHFMMGGAAAYELPTISSDDLVEKIRRIAQGEYLITSEVLHSASAKHSLQDPYAHCEREDSVTHQKQGKQPHDPSKVTDREITVLKQIMKGHSNKQIARTLGLSDQTIKKHITSILKKFQAHDRTAAVVIALRRELISLDDVQPCELLLDKEAFEERTQRFMRPTRPVTRLQPAHSYALAVNG